MAAVAVPQRDLTGRKLGRYEVLSQLASGGMATVYVARAQGVAGFERLVAVKVLHPHLAHDDEFISMFLDEARLAARIRHPNVVPTLDISDSQGDGYFLVMEYVEGDHFGALLREAARAGRNLPPGVTLRVVVDALEGLSAAHTLTGSDGTPLDIVHRDISPHNILVGSDGIARITDFGVAKAEVRLSSTRDGQFKGKLAYMAPEQASSGFADQRSDLFGMGVVLWEALVGRRLFKADNNGELLNRLLFGAIPAPSDFHPELAPLDAVLARALHREPDQRFQTAAEFVEAIEAAATAVGGIAGQRAVGRVVKELLGPKIERESVRIRTAIDSLGRSEVTAGASVPRPEGSAPGSGSQPSQVRRLAEDVTMGAKPSNVTEALPAQPAPPPSRLPWIVAGIVALLSLGGAAAWVATQRGASSVDAPTSGVPGSTAPTPSPADPAPTTPVPTPVAVDPTPSVELPVAPTETPVPASDSVEAAAEGTASDDAHETTHHRRRGASTGGTGSTAAPPTTPTPAPPPTRPSDDDEIILNPYQR